MRQSREGDPMEKPLLTVHDLARRWNCSASVIYALVAARQLGCVRIGLGRGCIRFDEELHVKPYVERQQQRKFRHLT